MNRNDRDILLPAQRDPWQILRDLRSLLPARRTRLVPPVEDITPESLCLAFEYLAAECQAAGRLLEELAESLAAKVDWLRGQGRLLLQCRLAEALREQRSERFFLALYLATRVPVPQARGPLLQMLTQAGLGHWSFEQQTRRQGEEETRSNGRGQIEGERARGEDDETRRQGKEETGSKGRRQPEGETARGGAAAARPGDNSDRPARSFDLRPVVVAALGQLRDPSLLGLFHRLLEKLSGTPGNEVIVTAVQWSLMNLAPGGQGEPVPLAMLAGRTQGVLLEGKDYLPARHRAVREPTSDGHKGQVRQDAGVVPPRDAAVSSERDDLLGGF